MQVRTRDVLVRLIGAVVGVGFVIGTFNDLSTGRYDWHGDIVRRADQPLMFWVGIGFDSFAALAGLMMLAFGTRGKGKR